MTYRMTYAQERLTPEEWTQRYQAVTLVAFDVDGTLTDGRIGFVGTERAIFFNTHDGHGIRSLREAGFSTAFVTANRSNGVVERAKSLRVLYQIIGREDKKAALEELGIPWAQIAYVGDDMNDVACMMAAALSFAPADAQLPAKLAAHRVLELPGGQGAAREVCDLILRAKGYEVYVSPDRCEWRKE